MKTWILTIQGVVQSVGFRPFIKNLGDQLSLQGKVINLGNKGVQVILSASERDVHHFVGKIHKLKPILSHIYQINVTISKEEHEIPPGFTIGNSTTQSGSGIAPLPPDIAICKSCLVDIKNPGSRKNYPFTSCTDCGPRYTTITGLPYDRPLTTFTDFPLCTECKTEYEASDNRRYHAQTTCCMNCGPNYTFEQNGQPYLSHQAISKASTLINEGKIIAIQGQGGTHYCCDALNSFTVTKLRKIRRKQSNKPFGLMMPNIKTIKKYCHVSDADIDFLESYRRPIVILPLKQSNQFQNIAPHMNSIGVMLPSTGLQHLIFEFGAPEIIVMTSANLPNLPMPITTQLIRKSTQNIADAILIHNRRIHQRNDDSVIRSHSTHHLIIRRSRGFTAEPIFHPEMDEYPNILALGSEEANTAAFLANGMILPTQHIGHITNLEMLNSQKNAIEHLYNLYELTPSIVVTDLHPDFLIRKNLDHFSKLFSAKTLNIQHHAAHAASLALDKSLPIDQKALIWSIDGFGFGENGNAWGCELIKIKPGGWERTATMQPIPYPGFDINAKYPDRMLLIYLHAIGENLSNANLSPNFKHGKIEEETLERQLAKYQGLMTTSMGRLLDSISALLDICHYRSFRGEPAMVLEQFALQGSTVINDTSYTSNGRINNIELFADIFKLLKSGKDKKNIANWALRSIASSLANLALHADQSIDNYGLSGGVAYNKIISERFNEIIRKNDVNCLIHEKVPPGDAGISIGQAFLTGRLVK